MENKFCAAETVGIKFENNVQVNSYIRTILIFLLIVLEKATAFFCKILTTASKTPAAQEFSVFQFP